jgi:hypothetical protein
MNSTSVHRFTVMGCEIADAGASPSARAAVDELFHERDQMSAGSFMRASSTM